MEKNKMFSYTELAVFLLWAFSLITMIGLWFNYDLSAWEYGWTGLLAFFNAFVLIQPIIDWLKANKRQKILEDKKKKVSK